MNMNFSQLLIQLFIGWSIGFLSLFVYTFISRIANYSCFNFFLEFNYLSRNGTFLNCFIIYGLVWDVLVNNDRVFDASGSQFPKVIQFPFNLEFNEHLQKLASVLEFLFLSLDLWSPIIFGITKKSQNIEIQK
jgi:hypothetical protein